MLLARLAVDRSCQGQGLGKALIKDALLRTAAAAEIAGIRALLVHAKDDKARVWYKALEFEPSPTDPRHLFLLTKDLHALLQTLPGDGLDKRTAVRAGVETLGMNRTMCPVISAYSIINTTKVNKANHEDPRSR